MEPISNLILCRGAEEFFAKAGVCSFHTRVIGLLSRNSKERFFDKFDDFGDFDNIFEDFEKFDD